MGTSGSIGEGNDCFVSTASLRALQCEVRASRKWNEEVLASTERDEGVVGRLSTIYFEVVQASLGPPPH